MSKFFKNGFAAAISSVAFVSYLAAMLVTCGIGGVVCGLPLLVVASILSSVGDQVDLVLLMGVAVNLVYGCFVWKPIFLMVEGFLDGWATDKANQFIRW